MIEGMVVNESCVLTGLFITIRPSAIGPSKASIYYEVKLIFINHSGNNRCTSVSVVEISNNFVCKSLSQTDDVTSGTGTLLIANLGNMLCVRISLDITITCDLRTYYQLWFRFKYVVPWNSWFTVVLWCLMMSVNNFNTCWGNSNNNIFGLLGTNRGEMRIKIRIFSP